MHVGNGAGLFTQGDVNFGANMTALKFGGAVTAGTATVLNAKGAMTVAMGVKQRCKQRTVITRDSLDSGDELPELQPESDDDFYETRSDTGSDFSVGTYDTNYFDDRVPHDEPAPCAYVARPKILRSQQAIGEPKSGAAHSHLGGRAKDQANHGDTTDHCKVCCKPDWRAHFNAKHVNCRDHCTHHFTTDNTPHDPLDDNVPELPRGTTPLPTTLLSAKVFHDSAAGGLRPDDATTGHREKELPAGDTHHHLITWYCLVAKPITRKEWPNIPAPRPQ